MTIDRDSKQIDPNWWKTKPVARKLLSAVYRPRAYVELLRESVDNCLTYGPRVMTEYGLRNLASDLYGQLAIAWSYGLDPGDWFAYRYWDSDWDDIRAYSDIGVIQGWLNEHKATAPDLAVCTNKIAFYHFCRTHEIPTIPIIGYARDGHYTPLPGPQSTTAPQGPLIVKPAAANSGDGIHVLSFDAGTYVDDEGVSWTWTGLTDALARKSERSGHAIIVQPFIRNAPSWQRFTSGGLATVRLLTGRFPNGHVECLRATLRMPADNAVIDNFSQGNLASAIDLDTGHLGTAVSKYPVTRGHAFTNHPDTEARIAGTVMPEWTDIVEQALHLNENLEVPVLGLDVTLSDRGVQVVEANPFYGRRAVEIPHGAPLSETRFTEIVRAWTDTIPNGEGR